jgi:hypothetical protein
MKKLLCVTALMSVVAICSARADEDSMKNPDVPQVGDHISELGSSNQMAGQVEQSAGTNPATQSAFTNEKQASDDAKAKLAPDAIRLQTSLMGAVDQLKGMRAQLKTTENLPVSKATVAPLRAFSKDVNTDVSRAVVYQNQLKSKAGSYQDVIDSDSFKSLKTAVGDTKSTVSSWESKTSDQSYWKNRDQAMSDLDSIEKQLNSTLDKAKSFSSAKLGADLSERRV